MLRLLSILVIWLLPTLAEARQVALVVGIAGYDNVAPLKNPQRDAAAMADRLRDLGFEVIEAFDADRFTFTRARRRFLDAARGADLALFYFAGHGIQLFDRNVLIARDADPKSAKAIEELGVDLNQLMSDLRAAGPVRTALLIDACRDNPLSFEETVALLRRLEQGVGGGQPVAGPGEQGARSVGVARRGLSVVALPSRGVGAAETLVFFAAQPGRVSFDGTGRNSYFVEALREAFGRPERPFSEILRDAGAYVRTVTRGEQVPQLVSDWTGDIVLGRASAARVRYINTYRAQGEGTLSEGEARRVGELNRAYPVFNGRFIVKESQAFTDNWRQADAAGQAAAKAIGGLNGFALDYDIDRDGRAETVAVYVLQTNVVLTVTDEGITLRDSPCWDFGGDQVEAVELALRDINGDRRPELFAFYRNELGSWGNLCVMEYVGDRDLANRRRGGHGTDWASSSLFRVLLRHEGAWTVSVGEDNSIETCAGSNCHTRSAYTFDGTSFLQTLDESDKPAGAKALPFRDQEERARLLRADAGKPGAGTSRREPVSQPAPVAATEVPGAVFERFVADVYLASGVSGSAIQLSYEPQIAYYGKTRSRRDVLDDKARYFAKWPRRSYVLVPGTVRASPRAGAPGFTDISFEYVFEVSDGRRRIAGRGRTKLTVRAVGSRFSIAAESGEVLQRR